MPRPMSDRSLAPRVLAGRILPMALLTIILSSCGDSPTNSEAVGDVARYPIVDTGQTACFDATAELPSPAAGQAFYGQDAQFAGNQPSYTKSSDGLTVHDNVTGLTWQHSPDTNGDGTINSADKMTLTAAQARPAVLNAARYGGYSDWRLPTIKELYSLMDFRGTDVGPGSDPSSLTPFIDRTFFDFGYGDTAAGERIIDAQYASSTLYVSTTMLGDQTLFGVNFADGRIKGYGLTMPGGGEKTFFVQCVRGAAYGVNDFVDNGDSTITDRATGLMWAKGDSGEGPELAGGPGLGAGEERRELPGPQRLAPAQRQGTAEHRGLHALAGHHLLRGHRPALHLHRHHQ